MLSIEDLVWNEQGLIPVIVCEAYTGEVLTLAYMSRESLQISIEKELCCFWSRSRGELWLKGESSGNYQHILSITADCDRDSLLIRVVKDGPACHLGTDSCFSRCLWKKAEGEDFRIAGLYRLLLERKEKKPAGSYTSYLFEKGRDKILKKLGEETAEVIIAAKADDRKESVYELADLLYHALVLMADMHISPEEICLELAGRQIIDHKQKQEKMSS